MNKIVLSVVFCLLLAMPMAMVGAVVAPAPVAVAPAPAPAPAPIRSFGEPSGSGASIGDRYAFYPAFYWFHRPAYWSDGPKPTTAKPFGTEDATVASARNGGKGFANSQASTLANQNPFVRFNAQGTGNGFGFGK